MGRKRLAGVGLPPDVHRVVSRGKPYFYWHPGRGTDRAGKAVRLPNPETHSRDFWREIERLQPKPEPPEMSVAAMLVGWSTINPDWPKLSEATQRDYARYIKFWREHIGALLAREVTMPIVAEVRDTYLGDRASTANHAVTVLSAAYIWGRVKGFSAINPCDGLPKLKIVTEGRRPWPAWALEIAHNHFRPELRRAVALGLYTGQRIGDVLRMRVEDVEDGEIKLRQSKTKKDLTIPVHRLLRAEIVAAKASGHSHLVSRKDGRPLSSQDFQAMWAREMSKDEQGRVRREGYSFHGLRTLAVAMLAEVCHPLQIAAITGQSLNIVEHYLKDHRQQTLARQAMKAWEGAEAEGKGPENAD